VSAFGAGSLHLGSLRARSEWPRSPSPSLTGLAPSAPGTSPAASAATAAASHSPAASPAFVYAAAAAAAAALAAAAGAAQLGGAEKAREAQLLLGPRHPDLGEPPLPR
jgi:hypothetical protein